MSRPLARHQFESGARVEYANLVQRALLHQGRFPPPPVMGVVEELHHFGISHPLKALLPIFVAEEQARADAFTRKSGETGNLHRHPKARALRFRWFRKGRYSITSDLIRLEEAIQVKTDNRSFPSPHLDSQDRVRAGTPRPMTSICPISSFWGIINCSPMRHTSPYWASFPESQVEWRRAVPGLVQW